MKTTNTSTRRDYTVVIIHKIVMQLITSDLSNPGANSCSFFMQ